MREKDNPVRQPGVTPQSRSIIDHEAIEKLKRRAADIGLIIHHQRAQGSAQPDKKKGGKR